MGQAYKISLTHQTNYSIEMNTKYCVIFFLLLFTATSCSEFNNKNWEKLKVDFETVLTIGADTSDIYFSFPFYGSLDSKGNLVVADIGKSELLVFDKYGKYIQSIGKRGPGPKEFRTIKGIYINENDEVYVFDRSSQSFKIFSTDGDFLRTEKSPSITGGVSIGSVDENKILFFAKKSQNLDEAYLLHLYDSDSFSNLVTEAVPISGIDYLNGKYAYTNFLGQGVNHVEHNDSIYLTPLAYNGIVYEYKYSNEKEQVMLKQKHYGNTFKKPVTYIENKNLDNINVDAKFSGYGAGEDIGVIHHNWSIGLCKTKRNNFAHFTFVENEDSRIFGIELYDPDFNPKVYLTLFEEQLSKTPGVSNLLSWKIIGIDDQNRIYVLDREDKPIVRVLKVNYDI